MNKQPHVFAHRGGRRWAAENTLSAFGKSVGKAVSPQNPADGIYGIELDIHKCKSGELVVIHDHKLASTTNGTGFVFDFTYDELKKLNAGSGEQIPLLTDVLNLVNGSLVIDIEIKNMPVRYVGIEDDLLQVLSPYQHKDKIVISSFDHETIGRIAAKTSAYKLAVLINGLIVDVGKYAKQLSASAWIPMFVNLRGDNVADAQAAGLEVTVWTLNTPEEWDAAIAMDVDGIVTDDPEALIAYLHKLKTPAPSASAQPAPPQPQAPTSEATPPEKSA